MKRNVSIDVRRRDITDVSVASHTLIFCVVPCFVYGAISSIPAFICLCSVSTSVLLPWSAWPMTAVAPVDPSRAPLSAVPRGHTARICRPHKRLRAQLVLAVAPASVEMPMTCIVTRDKYHEVAAA